MVCTRGFVDAAPVVGLGPISVRPDRQGRGVGHALMHAVLGAAEAAGEPLVALLGARFYRRFGFVPAAQVGIASPDPAWGEHCQVRTLGPPITGTFRYAAPFADRKSLPAGDTVNAKTRRRRPVTRRPRRGSFVDALDTSRRRGGREWPLPSGDCTTGYEAAIELSSQYFKPFKPAPRKWRA